MLLGLGLNAAALVIISLQQPAFPVLLGCIFLLGMGTTFLQVAGNPIMRDVSAEGKYSRNLAFAQGIKGIGSTASTYLLGAIASLAIFASLGWRAGFPLFCGLMVLAFVAVALVKVKETRADKPPSIGSSLRLLKEPVFLLAVIGIFLYVGAEASMGRFLKPILMDFEMKEALPVLGASSVGLMAAPQGEGPLLASSAFFFRTAQIAEGRANLLGPTMFFLLLTVGRLLGGVVLTVMSPRNCFRLSALLGVLGAAALMSGSQPLSLAGVVCAGLGFANIWPMLFSITVEERPECANELSGLMCMAISGGAIVPLLMAKLFDWGFQALAFAVPTACFIYLLLLSLKGRRQRKDEG